MDINFKINSPESQEKWTKASNEYYKFIAEASVDEVNKSVETDLAQLNYVIVVLSKLQTHIMSSAKARVIKRIGKFRIQLIKNSFVGFGYELDELILNFNRGRFQKALNINEYSRIEDEIEKAFDNLFGEVLFSNKDSFIPYSEYQEKLLAISKAVYLNLKSVTTSPKLFSFDDYSEVCYVLQSMFNILLDLQSSSIFTIKYNNDKYDFNNDEVEQLKEFNLNDPEIIIEFEKMDIFDQTDSFASIVHDLADDCQMNTLNKFYNILGVLQRKVNERLLDINDANINDDFFIRNKVIANDKLAQNAEFISKLDSDINDIYHFINKNIMNFIMNLKVLVPSVLQLEAMIKEYNEKGTISVDTYRFFGLPENDPTYNK